jgi:hypothetical protein
MSAKWMASVTLTILLGLSASSAFAQLSLPTVDLFREAQALGAPNCTVESCLNVDVDSVAQDVCVVAVLDGSSSMSQDSVDTQTRFQAARAATADFVGKLNNGVDQFGLVQYGTGITTTLPLTTNLVQAQTDIGNLPEPANPDTFGIGNLIACAIDPNGPTCPTEYTNLADGFRTGIGLLDGCTEGFKKAMIVTSDGVANRATIGATFTACTNEPVGPGEYPNACTSKAVALGDTADAAGSDVWSLAIGLDSLVTFDSLGIITLDSIATDSSFYFNTFYTAGGSTPIFDGIAASLETKSITNTMLADTVSACWTYIPGTVSGAGEPTIGTSGSSQTLMWDLGSLPGNDTTTVCYEMKYNPNGGSCPNNPASVDVNLNGGATFTQSDLSTESVTADTVLVDLSACTNLPVELTRFEATSSKRSVTLSWTTASELNNAGFAVEHAVADGYFKELDFVEGHGTTNREHTYAYVVDNLEPGSHTFRLKQVDFDGTVAFSPEIEVAVEIPDDYYLSGVYPNPFNPQASVRFWVARSQQVDVTLHDVTGRVVSTLYEGTPASKSLQTIRIDGSQLSSGTYLVRMQGEDFVDTKSVVLLK